MTRFDDDLARSQLAENLVCEAITLDGFTVHMPGREGTGRPLLRTPHGECVLPDLSAYKALEHPWIEVKLKSKADWTRCTGRFEHGFSLRLHDHYLEVERLTSRPVWLFVYECVTGDLLYAPLDELDSRRRTYTGNKMDRGGTVFYPRKAFTQWLYPPHLRRRHGLPEPLAGFSYDASPGVVDDEPDRYDWEAYLADCERYGWDPFEEEDDR